MGLFCLLTSVGADALEERKEGLIPCKTLDPGFLLFFSLDSCLLVIFNLFSSVRKTKVQAGGGGSGGGSNDS